MERHRQVRDSLILRIVTEWTQELVSGIANELFEATDQVADMLVKGEFT